MPRRPWLLLLTLLPLATPRAADERCADRCRELGECMAQQGDTCVAVFDEDCKQSEACTRHGRCTVRDGVCIADAEDDCLASEMCKVRGECAVLDGHCEAMSDLACQQSEGCTRSGRCTLDDAQCVIASAADCAGSERCASDGACGFRDGTCLPTLDAHCADSALCADDGLCVVDDGTCVEPAPVADTGTAEEEGRDPPIQLEGPLKRNAVRKTLRSVRPQAVDCGPLTAQVELHATIEPSGKVRDVAVLGVPRKQERCIAKALKKVRLPERKRPSTLTWRLHRQDGDAP